MWVFLLCLLIVPNLWSTDFLIDKSSKFSSLLKTRLGTVTYLKKSFLSNFIVSTAVIFFIQLVILVYIHLFLAPIKFNCDITAGLTTDASTYVSNEFINLIIFIIFNSIGYGIFSSFIFSLQLFLKNIYIYRIIGVILGLVLYTGTIVLAKIFSMMPIIERIISCFFIGYLINPGVMTTTLLYPNYNPWITFIITGVIYSGITLIFIKIFIKKECQYD